MTSKRILITGLSTHWGGTLARALESDPEVETIIGVDRTPPKVELERTEFVQVADSHSLIRRIVEAAEIDTVVDTRMVVDSIVTTPRRAHENNVIGTMNVLAACTGVKKVVFKSSSHYYGCEQDDPAFFTEAMRRPHAPRTRLEKDIVEAERAVEEFRHRNPETIVTVLRFANGIGPRLRTSSSELLGLPLVPMILGFDPRMQFIHEEDMANCLEHAVRHDLDGVYNCAGDGILALSEVISLLGKSPAPVLSPWATGLSAAVLRRAGLSALSPELERLMRFGRGLDNRKWKATGFRYRYTSRETIVKLREHQRLAPLMRGGGERYRYERELEEFLRRSPSVRAANAAPELPKNVAKGAAPKRAKAAKAEKAAAKAGKAAKAEKPVKPGKLAEPRPGPRAVPDPPRSIAPPTAGGTEYDELEAEEIIALLGELDGTALEALRTHEAANAARAAVLGAIDSLLARLGSPA